MFTLRYYYPHYDKKVNEEIINLLNKIRELYKVDFQIIQLRTKKYKNYYGNEYVEYIDKEHEKEIYESDFKPRARILKARIGESIRYLLRSRMGRGHYYIAGTIAITKNNQIEWFTSYSDRFKSYDENIEIGFLKAVLDKGVSLIEELCPPVEMIANYETSLLDKFIGSGVLKGNFKREVKVGKNIGEVKYGLINYTFDYRKSIDAICYTDNEVWILEAKKKLNYEALGEVLVYSNLYKQEHPEKEIRMGIICGEIETEILEVCKVYGITVFEVGVEEVKTY